MRLLDSEEYWSQGEKYRRDGDNGCHEVFRLWVIVHGSDYNNGSARYPVE